MIHHYACIDCLERISGKRISEMPALEHKQLCAMRVLYVDHMFSDNKICPVCDGDNIHRIYGLDDNYIKGYGYLDKKGVYNDMDLTKVTGGYDPYAEHRKPGDTRDLATKLRQNKEHNSHSKSVYLR